MTTPQHAFVPALTLGVLLLANACGDATRERGQAETSAPDGALQGVYGMAPPAVAGTPAVVILRPLGPVADVADRPAPRVDQLGLVFTPTELLVLVGERVVFKNSEMIAHNVHLRFIDADSTVLNVTTDPSAEATFVFDREGGYDVLCDTHPGMRAFVYATTSPYAALADRSGAFRIADMPPGAYTLSVWSVDASRRSEQTVQVAGPSTEVAIPGA